MLLTAASLGALIGLILALTGAGGGILAVPALTLGLGLSMTAASPVALLAVASAAATGMMDGLLKGHVRIRAALLISAVGLLVAPSGQHLARFLPERWLTGLFACVMLLVALRMILAPASAGIKTNVTCIVDEKTGRISWNALSFFKLCLIGLLSGLATGLLGVGGGFILVPALLRCSNISMNGIIATSLTVITLVSTGAVISALSTGQLKLSEPVLLFVCSTVVAMLLGRQFAEKIPANQLQVAFSFLLCCVSLLLFYSAVF
jgi:uncharacterized membrane protein YfcA